MSPWEQEQMQKFRSHQHDSGLSQSRAAKPESSTVLTRVLRMSWNKFFHRKTINIQPVQLDLAKEQMRKRHQPG